MGNLQADKASMRLPPRLDDPRSAATLAQQLRTARRQLHLAFFAACVLLAWLLVQPDAAPPSTYRVIAQRRRAARAAVAAAEGGTLLSEHAASLADAWDPRALATAAGDAAARAAASIAGAGGQGPAPRATPQLGAAPAAGEGLQASQRGNSTAGCPGSSGAAVPPGGNASWPFPSAGDTIHVFITSNGKPYVNWQTLVLYGTFLRAQRMPGGDKMVAFTRILHRMADDALVPGVPTWRVAPVRPECGGGDGAAGAPCKYVVAERPAAVRRFLAAARQQPLLIRAPWLYLIETDFVFVKPIQAPGPAESAVRSLAFRYTYIAPAMPAFKGVLRRLYPPGLGPLGSIPRTGPSPVLARVAEWLKLVDRWEGVSEQIEGDAEAVDKLGWVREMYAFSIAAAVERVPLAVTAPPHGPLIAQLPADETLGAAHAFHYTWGPRFFWAANHSMVWKFEKRELTGERVERLLPKVPMPPPFQPDVWTRRWERNPNAGPFTRQLYDSIVQMVTAINAGIDEVGGSSWKEVLGRRAALRRQDDTGAASTTAGAVSTSDTGTKAAGAPGGSAAAGTMVSASATAAGSAAALSSARADGAASTAVVAAAVATLESSRVAVAEGNGVDVLS